MLPLAYLALERKRILHHNPWDQRDHSAGANTFHAWPGYMRESCSREQPSLRHQVSVALPRRHLPEGRTKTSPRSLHPKNREIISSFIKLSSSVKRECAQISKIQERSSIFYNRYQGTELSF